MILENIMKLTYDEYVIYLKMKYGIPKYPYFNIYSTGNMRTNDKNSRTSEGLMIHHVLENKYVYLSNPDICKHIIKNNPETQDPKNLVYCDYIEHLILHIKITEDLNKENMACGWGGIISIIKHINSLYNYYYIDGDTDFNSLNKTSKYKIHCIKRIINQLNDYLYLIDYIMTNIMEQIISYSDGIIDTTDLWKVYEENKSFNIVKTRVKKHFRYNEYNKLSYNLNMVSSYISLSDIYKRKFNI